MPLPSTLSEISQTHLEQLIADRAQEGPHLDFKRDIPTNWDNSAKHEFLADASAFANAGGGDIVYGIAEDADAQASALAPQDVASIDQEVRRMLDFLLNSVEPRLPGVQVHPVAVEVGGVAGHAIVLRIPQSWAGPHRVKTNQHFYVRDGLRKRQLDLPEIKGLFLRSDSQAQKVRDFRAERLSKVITGETPCQLQAGPQLVVHAIPTQSALGLVQVDPVPYARRERTLPMLGRHSASSVQLNFDGAYGGMPSREPGTSAYTQLFRNGFFEAVWVLTPFRDSERPVLPGVAYEQYVNQFLGQVRGELNRQGLAWDMSVFVSLLGADQVSFAAPADFGGYESRTFDRRTILLPDVLIPADIQPGRGMRPAYDLMCQSVGLLGSENYGEDGEWQSPRG